VGKDYNFEIVKTKNNRRIIIYVNSTLFDELFLGISAPVGAVNMIFFKNRCKKLKIIIFNSIF